ncbi:MAG: methylated-DNA--[protein]-cysteine S-methyltransferase [Alcaligenaceae bacterium]|nr:methylated-DNA--[protein]-cysteine S-methyltransferase [Alcaligenaceae bacterium]
MKQRAPTINYASAPTALGLIFVATFEEKIYNVQFADDEAAALEELQNYLDKRLPQATLDKAKKDNPLLQQSLTLLKNYLNSPSSALYKELQALPLCIQGTEFQQAVWHALMTIPVGQTRSYTEIAQQLDSPKAIRAVANACASNRLGIIVPCHRVLRSDGGISGYRWGVARKKQLIAMEGKNKDR